MKVILFCRLNFSSTVYYVLKRLQNYQCSNANSLVKRRVMPDKCSHKTGRNKKKVRFKALLCCIQCKDDDMTAVIHVYCKTTVNSLYSIKIS